MTEELTHDEKKFLWWAALACWVCGAVAAWQVGGWKLLLCLQLWFTAHNMERHS